MTREDKPIRVFYSDLYGTGVFYATKHWKEEPHPTNPDATIITVTGKKYDVTQDIARAIVTNDVEFTPKSKDGDL